METLELKSICRLCGKQLNNTVAIHIFDSPNNYEMKIRTILPILVHKMDCLPKYLCHCCSDKLQQFHNFYMQAMKFDIEMKRKLSWMQNKIVEQQHGVPTVYFADLKSIKIKSEMENFENCDETQQNTDINSMKMMKVNCSMNELDANCHDDEQFLCLPRSTASDNNEQHCNNENNRLPLSVTVPLVPINNELSGKRVVKVLNSKVNLTDTVKEPIHDPSLNAHSSITNDIYNIKDNNNKNSSLILPQVLIKNETKENNEFVRKLRPRCKSISDRSSTAKMIKREKVDKRFAIKMDNKPNDLMTDLKLTKKVEIKVEKLNRDRVMRNLETATTDSNRNEPMNRNMNNNFMENKYNIRKKQKLEINNVGMENLKPLRTRNMLKNMETYASNVEIHLKGITVKLTKINVAQLKKQRSPRKSRDKITKMKKNKKIHDSYSCERCHELFTERELYRLHFCYLH